MKENIHPNYEFVEAVCACGNKFMTRSTAKTLKLDICAACHPFFTGKQKLLDTEGMVEKFNKRFAKTEGKTLVRKPKTEVKAKAKLAKKPVVAKKAATKKPAKKAEAKAEEAK
ncbi:50S ribosomal protein L31 [Candidatus Avelusimicrobium fimicolum]|jgi:large subunit ribosomal protein L31|uniref:50S ribosomal protein L31 n=1 Tax=Candidatus Avelusimicrobium TaxID=2840538 RepID=UPI002A87EFA1|nr:50S ribosomal protein L31 [Spirochaetia bacterium]MDY3911451.1 50S ribosomal protein L31 [Elusimicrobiaceae bacterium]